jgi:hypothetical protein
MHVLDLPSLVPLAVAQAPIALGLPLARDLVRKLAPLRRDAREPSSRSVRDTARRVSPAAHYAHNH